MKLRRMDNVGVVVDDLAAAIGFFTALGLELEGEALVEGGTVDRLVALDGVRCEIALMRTPDRTSRIELMRFLAPTRGADPDAAPANALGLRRLMFAVEGIDEVVARLRAHGAEPIGELVRYGNSHRLCYLRGPAGILVALAEQLG